MSKKPLYDSNQSRREFLRHLGIMAGASYPLIAAGCSPGEKKTAVEKSKSGQKLNLWGTGTLDIGPAWQKLKSDRGIELVFEDNQNDPGPVIIRLEDGEAKQRHVSGLQGGAESELANKGLAIPWDTSKIPSYASLWPWAKEIGYTHVNGKVYGIPSVINADSMIYLPEKTGKVTSYASVFDPKYRGKTSMEDAWINSVIFTAIYLKESHQAQIADPGNLTMSELNTVMSFLREKAREGQFLKLWSGWKDGVDLIVHQRVYVMTGWEPIVFEARRQGVNAAYAVPVEGYEGWSNDLILHPGARDSGAFDAAHELIDWELSGAYGAELATRSGYIVPTDNALKYAQLHPREYNVNQLTNSFENVKTKFFEMKGRTYWQNVRPKEFRSYQLEWDKFKALIK